jgi:hypothetical protein
MRISLAFILCLIVAPAWTAASKKPAGKSQKADWTTQKIIKGRWQQVGDPRTVVEFRPTSAGDGLYAHSFMGEPSKFVPYRITGKDRLELT